MAFDISWSSVDGYFRGPFPMGIKLSTIHNERAEPGAGSANSFDLWSPYWFDNSGIITRADYSDMEGREIEQNNALEYFHGTSLNNRKKLCEFRISDSSLAPTGGWVTLALMAFINGANLTVSAYRIIYAQGGAIDSSNEISVQRIMILSNVKSKVVAGQFARNGRLYVGIGYYTLGLRGSQASGDIYYITEENFISLFGGLPQPETEDPEFGPPSQPGGGYVPGGGSIPGGGTPKTPTFDNTSDKITVSTKPTLSPLNAKFLHAYVVTEAGLEYIGNALFPQPVFNQPDLISAMGELGQIIFFNKQIDYILDLLILPIHVPSGNYEAINVGGRKLETVVEGTSYVINGKPADDCYIDVTCGSISIDEYWVNFLDFAGTKVKLFLPYVGYVDIQPEYVIGGTLYVDYRFNILDGSFMAYVRSDSGYSQLKESLIGQYAGVAAVHVPLQSKDYSSKVSGLISAVGTVAAGAMSGGIGASVGAGAAASAANTIIQKPGSSHANGYNASSSFLSHRTPYLIIERQWSQFSEKYPEEIGLPSNVMCRLGDLYGLVKSENAHLDVIPASVAGKEKIGQLLADGIIL